MLDANAPPLNETTTTTAPTRKPSTITRHTVHAWLRPLLLLLILIVAGLFRFNQLNWDQAQMLHPDERYVIVLANTIRSPGNLKNYFDSANSSLNPFNTDWGRGYVYGTAPLFAGRFAAEFFDKGCAPTRATIPAVLGRALFGRAVADCNTGFFTGFEYMALVGRMLSGIYDLISLVALFLLGRKLFGWRVGLLATALSAAAALQIQQSHFFTVDSMAAMFCTLALYLGARIVTAQVKSPKDVVTLWLNAVIGGLLSGLAVASKISAWPIAAILIVCVVIALVRDKRESFSMLLDAVIAATLIGVFAFAGLRVAQPYGFVNASTAEWRTTQERCAAYEPDNIFKRVCDIGQKLPQPVRTLLMPTTRWLDQLTQASVMASGKGDAPFAHQWADRLPIVFPLINLVFWGLGLPLGIAACLGFAYMLRRALRGQRWYAHLPIALWVGGYFLYQGTQWVKSIRYLLPIYPALCLCAAVVLIGLWRHLTTQTRQNEGRLANILHTFVSSRLVRLGIPALVIVGAVAWALAFSSIYSEPITRVAASTWMYQNIPSAATLKWDSGAIHLPTREVLLQPGVQASINVESKLFKPILPDGKLGKDWPQPKDIALALNFVEGSGEVKATLMDAAANAPVAEAQGRIDAHNSTLKFAHVELKEGQPYYFLLDLIAGDFVKARTSRIGNEHWDDGLPWGGVAERGFGQFYDGVKKVDQNGAISFDGQIENYAEDDPEKLPRVLDWLDSADYLVLSSNRLYGSIPRLPWRFPMTTEYYRALLGGELGFALVADFNSFPRLGPINFNTQEMPYALAKPPGQTLGGARSGQIFVPYPTAEEAFSVYDHPRVLIFKKTEHYTRDNVAKILGKYDLTRVFRFQLPLSIANAPHGLLMDDVTKTQQAAGGTWSQLYPRQWILNQSQPLAVIAWVALIELLGVFAFALIAVATQGQGERREWKGATPFPFAHSPFPDYGYAFAKILGLLLVAALAWWIGSLKLTAVTPTVLWWCVAALVAVGAHFWYHRRAVVLDAVRARWKLMLAAEVVFLATFIFWLFVRVGNPDLWHPYMGGEKPMDFAYLNAILKSDYFPPYDPWFAGGYINYYYFGFVVIGWPIKALGIDPTWAYNLAVPTVAALTAVGAFGLGIALFASLSRTRHEKMRRWNDEENPLAPAPPHALTFPRLRATILAGLIAALFVVFIGNGDQIKTIGPAFQKLGGVASDTPVLNTTASGLVKWLSGAELPVAPNWPYWNASRPTAGKVDRDGRPLPDAIPIGEFPNFTFIYADLHAHMLAMPLAYLAIAFALAFAAGARRWPALALGALAAGALWPANSADYYPYLALCLAGLLLPQKVDGNTAGEKTINLIGGFVRALPAAVVFFALTKAFFVPYLATNGFPYNSAEKWEGERTQLDTYITIYATFMIPIFAFALLRLRHIVDLSQAAPRQLPIIALVLGAAATLLILTRNAPIAIFAMPLVTLALAVAAAPQTDNQERVFWFSVAGGFAITVFVELYAVPDGLGRMNTVFKFYIIAWLLLGVCAAVATLGCIDALFGRQPANLPAQTRTGLLPILLRPAFAAGMVAAVTLAALYPVFAVPGKIKDRYIKTAPTGLDGMAYMPLANRAEEYEGRAKEFSLRWDHEAIKWMQDNVQGSPVILEEGSARGNQYRWSGRFSIYTGLPTVVGWQWHQRQQRKAMDERVVYDRDDDVAAFYKATDLEQARTILRRYNVKYIVLGDMEKIYLGEIGLPKYSQLLADGTLRVAYQNEGTTIYEVINSE